MRNPDGSLFEGVPAIQLYCPEAAASASLELPGMSGGPVLVGKDPEVVVGIIRWNPQHPDGTAQAQGGMVFACPIKNVLEELPALEVHAVRRVRPKAPSAPQVLQPWLRRPGAPRFHMHPGINLPRQLLNRFEMQADVTPADMQARWVGPGINMDFVAPMRQNTPNQYRMKGVQMEPEGTEDTVTFEVRFWLEDGEHGGRWKWPVLKHSKGHWEFHTELGSGVNQPKPEDTW